MFDNAVVICEEPEIAIFCDDTICVNMGVSFMLVANQVPVITTSSMVTIEGDINNKIVSFLLDCICVCKLR